MLPKVVPRLQLVTTRFADRTQANTANIHMGTRSRTQVLPVQAHEIKNLETLDRVGTVVLDWYARARKSSSTQVEVIHDGAKEPSSEPPREISSRQGAAQPDGSVTPKELAVGPTRAAPPGDGAPVAGARTPRVSKERFRRTTKERYEVLRAEDEAEVERQQEQSERNVLVEVQMLTLIATYRAALLEAAGQDAVAEVEKAAAAQGKQRKQQGDANALLILTDEGGADDEDLTDLTIETPRRPPAPLGLAPTTMTNVRPDEGHTGSALSARPRELLSVEWIK